MESSQAIDCGLLGHQQLVLSPQTMIKLTMSFNQVTSPGHQGPSLSQ